MKKLNIDCLILIFNELRADNKSLYSCLLVNKEWCHLIVPILWEKYPYYFNHEKSKEKFSNTILSCLPTSSKQLLFDNNIKLPSTILSKSPTFNYINSCKFLKANIVDNIINMVYKEEILNKVIYSTKRNLLEQEIYSLFISQCKSIKELEWRTSQPLPSFPGAQTCFSQLYSLNINLFYVSSNNLYEMAQICKDLNELYIYNFSRNIPGLISLIDAQRNLKSLSFSSYHINKGTCQELSYALARKSCTINKLSLCGSVVIFPYSVLTSLINLKNLKIYGNFNSYEGIKEFQEYLAISNFPDLQSLDISGDLSCFKELAMLIEKTKGNISDVFVNTSNKSAENSGMLFKAISNHCPKIKYLTTHLGPEDLIYLKSLLKNCRNLKSLWLDSLNENDDIGDKLLDILTKFSPKSLVGITISSDWRYTIEAFERFFESYRERKLFYFDIYFDIDIGDFITTEHVNVVKKYFDEGVIENSNILDYSRHWL
jgi:hypothetical protein